MERSRSRIVFAAAVLAAVAIAPATGAAVRPPCSLLTNAEVARALGAKIQTRQAHRFGCEWQSVPLGNFTSAHKTLHLDAGPVTRGAFKSMPKRAPSMTPFHGVGQLAFVDPDGNGSYQLYVWQDGTYLELSVVGVSSPLETEKALAKVILARL